MRAKRSLPPELQALIDKYSSMLDEYGFNMPYMDTGFESYNPEDRVLYSSPDKDASGSDWGFKEDAAWREANISPNEWNRRVDELTDLYNSIIEKAVGYMNRGEIEQSAIRGMAASPTYAYDKIFDPSTGRTVWLSHHATDTPQFRSTRREESVSPMKAIKVGDQPARVERTGLQKSRPMDLPKVDKELIMRANQAMRTGQEPNYYIIKDGGGRKRVRPVEEEELLYYRDKNRIQR
jgi:hypothetical protein